MKKIMIIFAALVFTISANAQSTAEDGIKMYNYGKMQSAQGILAPLTATNALANYYLGLTYLAQGDAAKANNTFVKYPDDPANISGMARVAFVSKDVAKGMQIVKELAAKSKKKEWIQEKYAADAITYTTGGDYQQAIAWYKDALTKSDDADAHIGLGDAFRKIPGGGGDAMNNYEHVTEKDAKNSLGYSRIGDLWYEAKNYQSAVDNYNKAKDADNTNPLPYKALGNAYQHSGKYELALQNAQQYYNSSDKSLADKIWLTEITFLAKKACDAVKLAKELMDQPMPDTTKTELYGILGFSLAECGDSVEAIRNMRIWLQRRDPKKILPGDYVLIGKLFLKMDMLDSAVAYYNKGIMGDTAQNKTDIYRQIAEAYKTKKSYCISGDWYNNLIKANPATQPADYAWRGIMYWYCKDYSKAMDAFNDFAAKYPDQPTAMFWQGRTGAAIDSEATKGNGVEYFLKWLDKVGPNYENKKDLKGAYAYLLYYYYNTKDMDKVKEFKEKIRSIDPADRSLKDLEEMEKANSAPKKTTAPAKAKK